MQSLETWFTENKRSFPWREETTAYRVWISEIMLQQTRASVVVSYFQNWMQRFPDIQTLSDATIDEVLKMWEGLGYYSRARNIHKAAKWIVENYEGNIPSTYEELIHIPGFGPYTAGAVLNFAFRKRAYAIDGNVNRVMARILNLQIQVSKAAFQDYVKVALDSFFDQGQPWVISEALIELGAQICSPKPKCEICPLANICKARSQGIQENLPLKGAKKEVQHLYRLAMVFECQGEFLVKQNKQGSLMQDLYEFPYVELKSPNVAASYALKSAQSFLNSLCTVHRKIPSIEHTFTSYKAHLYPFVLKVDAKIDKEGYEWLNFHDLSLKTFSSGHKKILGEVEKIFCSD